jgi:hypothetical protein
MTPPVKINYYGLCRLTRTQYLVATAVAGLFAVVVLFLVAAGDRLPPVHGPWEPLPANAQPGWRGLFFHHFYTIIAVFLLAEIIDIAVTLRKFSKLEAEARDAALNEQTF